MTHHQTSNELQVRPRSVLHAAYELAVLKTPVAPELVHHLSHLAEAIPLQNRSGKLQGSQKLAGQQRWGCKPECQ